MWTGRFIRFGTSLCVRTPTSSVIFHQYSGSNLCGRLRQFQASAISSTSARLCMQSPPTDRLLSRSLIQLQLTRNELTIVRDYRTESSSRRNIYSSQRRIDDKNEHKTKLGEKTESSHDDEPKGLWARFKWMFKRYWYLAVPVHVVTSLVWFGSFYLVARSGIDVIALLEYLEVIPESWLNRLKATPAGADLAVAYLLYKIATPARYFVTVYGTHLAIKILRRSGHLHTTKEVGIRLRHRFDHLHQRYVRTERALATRWKKRQRRHSSSVKPKPPPKSD